MTRLSRLERQLIRNGGVTTLGQLLTMGLRFGVQLALAWLLLPSDFGLYGLALLVMMVLAEISEGSVGPPTVRAGDDEQATSTALLLGGCFGLAAAAAAYLLAPALATLFGDPALTDMIRLMAVGLIASGLAVAPISVLERRQQFDRRVAATSIGAAVGALTTIGLALQGAGAFALAWGWVVAELTNAVLAWWLAGWWPRARATVASARRLLSFGRFTASTGLLVTLVSNIDDAVVGKVLGLEALGFYGLAYGWANLLSRLMMGPLARVLFPSFLQASAEPGQLARLYLRVLRGGAMVAMPVAALLMLLGPTMVAALLGPTWAPVGPLLQVLSVLLLARGLALSQGSLLSTLDRPHWRTSALSIELLVLAIGLVPVARQGGLLAVALLVSAAAMMTAVIGLALARRALGLHARQLIVAIGLPALATAIAGVVTLAVQTIWAQLGPWPMLLLAGGVFVGAYATVLALLGLRGGRLAAAPSTTIPLSVETPSDASQR